MPAPQTFAPYYPIAVAANLRFTDTNGILVTEMYPMAATQILNTPATGYISLIGSKVSDLLSTYQQVSAILAQYNTRITTVEGEVNNILTSGVTFQLYVNGGCLLGNTTVTVPAAVTALMTNSCAYNTVLGTTTNLALAIAAQCSGLNNLPAFSQSGTMSGLAGWYPDPQTIAQSESNQWKAYCDARTGITNALASVTPTCAQVIIGYQATLNSLMTFNLYFSGYTFIPTGYADTGSIVKITDTSGNIYQTSFNIVTQSTTTSPLVLLTSGSTLSPTSAYYVVDVKSNVANATLGTTCIKETFQTVYTNSGNSEVTSNFDIGNYTTTTSGTTSIVVVSGLSYTPRAINLTPKNTFSSNLLYNQNYNAYIQNTNGGATLILAGSSGLGTINYDWVAFR